MKKKLFICLGTIAIIMIYRMPSVKQKTEIIKSAPIVSQSLTPEIQKEKSTSFENRRLASVETIESIRDRNHTKTDVELRNAVRLNLLLAEREKLFHKANAGILTLDENKKLAYVIRTNTALRQILLERLLAQN